MVRDVYYEALLERLKEKVPGIAHWTRTHVAFSRLPPSATPAAMLLVANQEPREEFGLPTVWTLGADLVIWVTTTGQEGSLDTVLNGLVDSVEAALLRDEGEPMVGGSDSVHTTLGGLVQSCTLAGPIDFNQREGAQAADVVIPIDMVVLGDDPGDE